MLYPQPLEKGNKIAIISPSGKIAIEYIEGTTEILKNWGLEIIPGNFANAEFGRFSGTDEERLQDLQWALDDKNITAILCSRGGYGLVRILKHLSFDKFRRNPKWVIGYSDITALHASIFHSGIVSVHAPMCRHFSEEGEDTATLFLKDILLGKLPKYEISSHPLNKAGISTGTLYGGNLSVLCGLRGTPFDIIPENTILFIEDIGERPYQIERMMYNLKLGGILEQLSGLIVGQFTDYEEDPLMMKSLLQSIADLTDEYNYPVCFNFPVGHVKNNYPMICGASVILNVNNHSTSLSFE